MNYEIYSAIAVLPLKDIKRNEPLILISREDGHVAVIDEDCFLKSGGMEFMRGIKNRLPELSYIPSAKMAPVKDLKLIDII